MRPSRAQLRLAEYQAMDKELKDQILVAISDALDTRIDRKMNLDMNNSVILTIQDQGIGDMDDMMRFMPWCDISTSRLLEIYSQIVKTLSL